MAFNTCAFQYDGVSCEEYGLMYYEIAGNSQSNGVINGGFSPVSDHVSRRLTPIHYGVEKSDHMEFDMIFGSLEALDRSDIEEIAKWLVGRNQYAPLVICQEDMYGLRYNAIISDMEIIDVAGIPYAFSAHVTCDSPYAYTEPISYVYACNGTRAVMFNNLSNVPEMYAPDIRIELQSGSDFKMENKATGEIFSLELNGENTDDITEYIGGESKVLKYEGNIGAKKINLYRCMKLNGKPHFVFPRFVQGNNILTVTGNCVLHIDSEFPMSIGY